jgi:hypothetical protein
MVYLLFDANSDEAGAEASYAQLATAVDHDREESTFRSYMARAPDKQLGTVMLMNT